MLNGLDLFSGIGGLTIALQEWVRPVAYCEIEPYAAGVLFSRMLDGAIPVAPIFPDVRKLTEDILPDIDIIYGGFPCQDISCAGLRKGLEGERSKLFFEVLRLVHECKPSFVFLENVPGIKKYRETIFDAFAEAGYVCRDGTLAAGHVGACHKRDRWWFLAYRKSNRCERAGVARGWRNGFENCDTDTDSSGNGWRKGRAESARKQGRYGSAVCCTASTNTDRKPPYRIAESRIESYPWTVESPVCRPNDGILYRAHRIKACGNAVVPQCAKAAFERLLGL